MMRLSLGGEWQVQGRSFGSHYLSGSPPFDLAQYRAWLRAIAALDRPFDPDRVAH
jgi:beta-mannosidase